MKLGISQLPVLHAIYRTKIPSLLNFPKYLHQRKPVANFLGIVLFLNPQREEKEGARFFFKSFSLNEKNSINSFPLPGDLRCTSGRSRRAAPRCWKGWRRVSSRAPSTARPQKVLLSDHLQEEQQAGVS
jgi:hypothetical protein